MFRKIGKVIKKFVIDKIQTCKEVLTEAQNRLVIGLVILGAGIGIGSGFIASAYLKVPA